MFWKAAKVLPNCFLSLAYAIASSKAPCAIPKAWDAIPILPPSRVIIAILNPFPLSPNRFSLGILQFSNINSQVADPLIPSFFSFLPIENPGVLASTIKAEIPFNPFDLSVIANTTYTWAYPAFVINIFDPFKTHSLVSESKVAIVCCPAASVPAFGSVSPNAPIHSPLAIFGKYFCFCFV